MLELSSATLPSLPKEVAVPGFERSGLKSGIVHFGLGHFHRAHQAAYLDELMNSGHARDWAICGAGVMPTNSVMRDVLSAQDYLYTLTAKEPDGQWTSRVIGSINGYMFAPDDPGALVSKIADPTTRIVSLTITEGGYGIDNVSGHFTGQNDMIQADLRADVPNGTVFGLVLQAMRRRKDAGLGGLTIMSCDNVQGNGKVARLAFLGFAEQKDPEIARWMEQEVLFPNSMVDRVTPGTVDADRDYLANHFGYRDRWPVTCEPFFQWVLEDKFVAGRPPLEDAGVDVVKDVEPYELMKLHLANGTHQALCYFGYLLGYDYVHEAITDPDINAMLIRYIDEEAVPMLHSIPGVDFHAYGRKVIERFSNPQIRDRLTRICEDTSDRIPKFLLPVVFEQLKNGGPVRMCAAVVASWARYAEGMDEQGKSIDVRDPLKDELMVAAQGQKSRKTAFIENRAVFGDLCESREFVNLFVEVLDLLHQVGARGALRALNLDPPVNFVPVAGS